MQLYCDHLIFFDLEVSFLEVSAQRTLCGGAAAALLFELQRPAQRLAPPLSVFCVAQKDCSAGASRPCGHARITHEPSATGVSKQCSPVRHWVDRWSGSLHGHTRNTRKGKHPGLVRFLFKPQGLLLSRTASPHGGRYTFCAKV